MKKLLLVFLFVFALPAFATGINGASAPCDNATLAKYTGTADIEINWEPNTINLNWYDGDTKLSVQQSAQSCVYDGTLTVPTTQPTKPGYTFNGWKVIHVPGGYTELEYLESTGTQYIDMGLTVRRNTLAKFEYQFTDDQYSNYVWGQVAGGESAVMGFRTTRTWWFYRNDQDGFLANTQKHSVEYSPDGNIYWDGNVIGVRGPSWYAQDQYTILLFAERNDNNAINKGRVKIFNFTLKEGDIPVRNFIPARRNSDGVLGMYDTVTDTFFTNAGMGTFVAGPAVQ